MIIKILLSVVIILLCEVVYAETYLYRIRVASHTVRAIQSIGDSIGKVDERQPFYSVYTLLQANTNYFILKVTPKNGKNPKLETLYKGVDLHKVLRLDSDGFIRAIVDNSKKYPVEKEKRKSGVPARFYR